MIYRGALQVTGAAAANAEKFRCFRNLFMGATDASEAFAKSGGDGTSHGFAGFPGESLSQVVSFGVFDVEAHCSTPTE